MISIHYHVQIFIQIQTVYDMVENPQMIRLSKKRPHGISAACEKICILRP